MKCYTIVYFFSTDHVCYFNSNIKLDLIFYKDFKWKVLLKLNLIIENQKEQLRRGQVDISEVADTMIEDLIPTPLESLEKMEDVCGTLNRSRSKQMVSVTTVF